MRRIVVHIALVFCMVWQAGAFAYFGAPDVSQGDSAHARMHLQMESHHHDVDGSLELDDSVASLLHITADLAGSAFMVRELSQRVLPTAAIAPRAMLSGMLPTSYLEGPLRPPRPSA